MHSVVILFTGLAAHLTISFGRENFGESIVEEISSYKFVNHTNLTRSALKSNRCQPRALHKTLNQNHSKINVSTRRFILCDILYRMPFR